MNKQLERRLDKVLLFDRIAVASRLVRSEQRREAVIADRRRVSRVPGAAVQFIPRDWLDCGVSQSFASQLLGV